MNGEEGSCTLVEVEIKNAVGRPGCPLCRLRQEREKRYLFHLLYENVNDPTTRARLVHALGLCARHAWDLQAAEQHHWGGGMGNGIIYEDLVGRVLSRLNRYVAHSAAPWHSATPNSVLERLRAWLERRGRWGPPLARRLPRPRPARELLARLSPTHRCRVCEITEQSEESDVYWFLRLLAASDFRARYAASDGLCLPHLRRVLPGAQDEETVRFLARSAADRLSLLHTDVQEYVRKHNWEYRDEPRHAWERTSWVRAVAFFAGEPPDEQTAPAHQARRQALDEYHRREDHDD